MDLTKTKVFMVVVTCILLMSTVNAQVPTVPEVSRDKVICFALYTVHNNIMKMTAQLYPLEEGEDRVVRLETNRFGSWKEIARAEVIERGWTAVFRIENWDMTKDIEYRLAHGKNAYYTGIVRKDPVDKETIVVAAFTGNSIYKQHGGDIPKNDIVGNLKKIKPNLLFFSGDQVYDHNRHYAYWLKFGRDFGDIIRNTPTITIPDDHDVGQANLWGHGGRLSHTRAGHDGGYAAPVEYVKEVERAQTSHLPDPYDPTPIERSIGVYYTSLTVGRVSFAIIEDRKFKTGPQGLVPQRGPRPDHVLDPSYDPKSVDVPNARLLGERQLKFLPELGTVHIKDRYQTLWQHWIKAGDKYARKQFEEYYPQWKAALKDKPNAPSLHRALKKRMLKGGVAAVPYLIAEIEKGDDALIPVASELTKPRIRSRIKVLSPKLQENATRYEALEWWKKNKQKWTVFQLKNPEK